MWARPAVSVRGSPVIAASIGNSSSAGGVVVSDGLGDAL